ncbi:MAG TPA: ABC transporter ATP-binding protein [Ktedonobacteraceae bacterium]|jgi:ABC-type multidrug transport system fused ATPase/permease subunit|nr:ABC transporter ATP-binding protein [Ktedonobacteraceae bacterium]
MGDHEMKLEVNSLQRKHWRENTLEMADEDLESGFDWATTKKFIPYVARYKKWTLVSIALMLVYTGLNVANPFLIGVAIDQFISQNNLEGLALLSVVLIVVNVVMWQAQYWQVWTMSWAGQQILYHLSSDMFTHLESLSLSFYDKTQVGRVMSRLQSDIDVLEQMLSSGLLSMLGSLVALVGIVGAMLVMDVPLALLSFTVLPIMFIIAAFWQRHAQRSFRRTRAAISWVNATLQENISGMRVIQSLARESRNRSEFDELNAYNRETNQQASRIAALILPLVEVVAAMAIAITVLYGGWLVSKGQLEVGVLVAFTLYINRFFDPIRDISQQYSQLQRAGVAAERIFQILGMPVEIVDKPGAEQLPQVKGEVEFRDVTFGYSRDLPVLRHLNLRIQAGQTVAIVGPTGAGKTTIAGLIARFYDIQEGAVYIDGHDVREVTQASLRSQIGIVLQEPFLFTGTIRDNIRYGRLDATDAEVEEAARAVGAHGLIAQLPEGYETPIRERGRNLSVGQRQLISFARALLADPRILILDEATANIDTFTELLVQQGLRRLLHGRTAIVIAHRLSTIKNADCIVVLQKGKIIEQGTHAELLEQEGAYASLYAMGFRHTSQEAEAS